MKVLLCIVVGSSGNQGHTITLKKCISLRDETGAFNPSYDETQTENYSCDYVLLSVGQDIIPVEGLDINIKSKWYNSSGCHYFTDFCRRYLYRRRCIYRSSLCD